MKSKTLTILAFSLMAAPIFCGNDNSKKSTRNKIKIADKATLTDSFKKKYPKEDEKKDIDYLIWAGYMEPFADQLFDNKAAIERMFDATLDTIWKDRLPMLANVPEKKNEAMYQAYKKNYQEKKPTILRLLLESSEQIEDQ